MNDISGSKISPVILQWGEVARAADLSAEEAINAAGQWLATLILCSGLTERQAHDVLNSATENAHLYINENWRAAQAAVRLSKERR